MNAYEIDPTYQNPDADKGMQRQIHYTRKPKITLANLNKLKKMRAAKDLEELMRGDFLEIIYGPAEQEQPGGMGL
jgi:hypothetical protein